MQYFNYDDIVKEAGKLGQILSKTNSMICTAESCTGGLIASALTEIAGSSVWFDRGYVTYTNQAKTEQIGVDAHLLQEHGAVSESVARAMAHGALVRSSSDISLAVTGVAGPSGGSSEKPVGTVWLAWCIRQKNGIILINSKRMLFLGDRKLVRLSTAGFALSEASAFWQQHHLV